MADQPNSGPDFTVFSGLAAEFSQLLQDIREARHGEPDNEAGNCRQCPLCLVITAVKKQHPETAEKISNFASGLITVADTLLQNMQKADPAEPTARSQPADSPDNARPPKDKPQSDNCSKRDSGKNSSQHVQRITIHHGSADDAAANTGQG